MCVEKEKEKVKWGRRKTLPPTICDPSREALFYVLSFFKSYFSVALFAKTLVISTITVLLCSLSLSEAHLSGTD